MISIIIMPLIQPYSDGVGVVLVVLTATSKLAALREDPTGLSSEVKRPERKASHSQLLTLLGMLCDVLSSALHIVL
jgi:hypothetical protein